MSIAVKSGLPSLGSTEGAVITKDDISVTEETSPSASAGEDLPRGKSAYEVAVENGFSGTETEWLASLKGEPGAAGASGKDGTDGKTPYVGDNGNWYIGADDTGKPSRGEKGDKGEKGDTGAQGIQGEQGIQGVQGEKGEKGDTGAQGIQGVQGAKGDKGDPGATPNLTIGSVTTLEAGQNATASMGGTAESPVLNLGIPRGAKGEPGQGGAGAYYVELDGEFPNYTLSETTPLADIKAAYNDGKALFCRCSMGTGKFTLPLLRPRVEENTWLFSGTTTSTVTIFVSAGSVSVFQEYFVLTDAIVTSVSAESTDSEVPSAKCLYDELQKRNLKQATSDTLGGVKADPAEAADTQPVRIGGDGKLYTAPGGTDISLGLTSAAVGQIIKVKAVDESGKPTEWEAANMPSGGSSGDEWELIADVTISEPVNSISADVPSGKNELLLFARGKWGTEPSNKRVGFKINGRWNVSNYTIASSWRYFKMHIIRLPQGYVWFEQQQNNMPTGGPADIGIEAANMGGIYEPWKMLPNEISNVSFSMIGADGTLNTGFQFMVFGR